jgi:Flp pilus assembly protein TadG
MGGKNTLNFSKQRPIHNIMTIKHRRHPTHAQGQNLVELTLLLPFFLILVFAVIEIGNYWQTTETIKIAAMDGAYAAANMHNATVGTAQMQTRLAAGHITFNAGSSLVNESADQSA